MRLMQSVFVLGLLLPLHALIAHPGDTASDGCHYCRTNCNQWGELQGVRHCHSGAVFVPPDPKGYGSIQPKIPSVTENRERRARELRLQEQHEWNRVEQSRQQEQSGAAHTEGEVTLFDLNGMAIAYVAVDDELTVYLWSGKPVAYLEPDNSGGYHVYGFNGKHLGWFLAGVMRDHTGGASCVVKSLLKLTEFESFKSFKQFRPFKTFKQFAPFRPSFSNSFGETLCHFFLAAGAAN